MNWRKHVLAAVLSLSGLAAAVGGAGLYTGSPEVFGLQFTTPAGWRMSVGMSPERGRPDYYSTALSLDFIFSSGLLYQSDDVPEVNYYAGAGVTGSLLQASPEINGHAMLGVETYIGDMNSTGFFAELQLGQSVWFAPVGTTLHLGARFGVALK
ncbi:hypothetical protein [Oceanithermus sp.]